MKYGRVVGDIVCTQKVESWEGVKLMLVQPLDEGGADAGELVVACDPLQSGPGDTVLFEGGREAAMAMQRWFNPSDATITAIVDRFDVDADRPGGAASRRTGGG
ncbi:MAG: EutN/CcmL family microcompartment protein [bacterium]